MTATGAEYAEAKSRALQSDAADITRSSQQSRVCFSCEWHYLKEHLRSKGALISRKVFCLMLRAFAERGPRTCLLR